MKAPSAVSGSFKDIVLPPDANAVDWEVEFGMVIGSRAQRVSPDRSLAHVAGYCKLE
jgi:2-keto-4-pentenoate hydratase/2-oxohepta-3-ene-1,7-dioic acid hydratase in catechol pathway